MEPHWREVEGDGTVFRLSTNGTDFGVLKYFTYSEGHLPTASPILLGDTLYGTTAWGSVSNMGTVYRINTDGTGFKILKSFTGPDGGVPRGSLLYSDGALYGTTEQGGTFGKGTVFKIQLSAPTLTIQSTGNSIVLSWSNTAFALQAAPTVTGPYTTIPQATSPFTNVVDGGQQFFRLIGN
jgi:hypothetical protein